jgi:predicted ribosomally synthesized peptide with SipW-like signal peptide
MARERPEFTRRQILGSIGGAGAFGLAAAGGTMAALDDSETTGGSFEAGEVGITVDCDDCTVTDGRVEIAFGSLEPGDEGIKRLQLSAEDSSTPVQAWLRTACPPTVDPLGEALESRLVVRRDCQGDSGGRTFPLGADWLSFTQLRRQLHDGVRLDDPDAPCLDGETLCLDLEYRLPATATWTTGTRTGIELEVRGRQCRQSADEAVGDGPFPDAECPTVDCQSCVELGTVDIDGGRLEPATVYSFDEVAQPFDADGHDYAIETLTVTNKISDDTHETVCTGFRLLQDRSERDAPPLCRVTVSGGPTGNQPARAERNQSGDPEAGRVDYDVDPPLTRPRGDVCAAHDTERPERERDRDRPGISTLTVSVCQQGGSE